MQNPSAPAYKDLVKEKQAYMNYIAAELLPTTGVLLKDKIDTNDDIYKAWKKEKINLYEYINHAISQNWIDTSVIQKYIHSEGKYSDSHEVYQGILNYISDYLSIYII